MSACHQLRCNVTIDASSTPAAKSRNDDTHEIWPDRVCAYAFGALLPPPTSYPGVTWELCTFGDDGVEVEEYQKVFLVKVGLGLSGLRVWFVSLHCNHKEEDTEEVEGSETEGSCAEVCVECGATSSSQWLTAPNGKAKAWCGACYQRAYRERKRKRKSPHTT